MRIFVSEKTDTIEYLIAGKLYPFFISCHVEVMEECDVVQFGSVAPEEKELDSVEVTAEEANKLIGGQDD